MKKIHCDSIPDFNDFEEQEYFKHQISFLSARYELKTGQKDETADTKTLRKHFLNIIDFAKFITKIAVPELNTYKLKIELNHSIENAELFLSKNDERIPLENFVDKFPDELSVYLQNIKNKKQNFEASKHAYFIDNQFELNSTNKNETICSEDILLDANSCLENPFFKNIALGILPEKERLNINSYGLKESIRDNWIFLTHKMINEPFDPNVNILSLKVFVEEFKKEGINLFNFILKRADVINDPQWTKILLSLTDKEDVDYKKFISSYLNNNTYLYDNEDAIFDFLKNKDFSISNEIFLDYASKGNFEKVKQLAKLVVNINPVQDEKPILFSLLEMDKIKLAMYFMEKGANPTVEYNQQKIKDFITRDDDAFMLKSEIALYADLDHMIKSKSAIFNKKLKLTTNIR